MIDLASDGGRSETLRLEGRGMALRHADYGAEMKRVQALYGRLLGVTS